MSRETEKEREEFHRQQLEHATEHRIRLAAKGLLLLDIYLEQEANEVFHIKGYSLKVTDDVPKQFLVIVKAVIDGEHCVAFHSSPSHSASIRGFAERLTSDTLKWRKDEWA